VTRKACCENRDVFSFELDGMRLLPSNAWPFYCAEIVRAKREYILETQILRIQNRSRISGEYNPLKDYPMPTGIFTWGPAIPAPPRRPLTKQETDILNKKLQCATNDYLSKQALAFYQARAFYEESKM
jgi:hypothetical protein